jgi:hypothetical protein
MKQPILHVKKGADLYNDADESGPLPDVGTPARQKRPGRGAIRQLLRRGGSTFLPLVVIALALLLVFREIPRGPGPRASILGWDVALRAMPYQGSLLVGVTFIRRGAESAGYRGAGAEAQTATVKFLARETGEGVAATEQLSRSPITLSGRLGDTGKVKTVAAEVAIGAEKTILVATVQQPP